MSRIVGIDLGTTNSCIAYMEGAEAKVVPTPEGARTVPSVVAFTESGEKLVGRSAKRQLVSNPKRTFFSVKRLIGRKYNSPFVQEFIKKIPYEVVPAENGDARIKYNGKILSPQEVSAYILMYLRDCAESFFEDKITKAVVTVPANFDDAQRQATKDAGKIAGLEVLRIINEPTAACLAYGLHKKKEGIILVYDLGVGTFDVSILEVKEGVFKVLSTTGDPFLGGNDFDKRIADWIIEDFKKREGVDLSDDPFVYQKILESAEKAKMELSYSIESEINIPYVYVGESGAKHLNIVLSRDLIEKLTEDLVDKTIPLVAQALKEANLTKFDIDEAILVGGQTRMPLVKKKLIEFLEKEPRSDINPDEVVAIGAAVQGAILRGDIKDIVLLDVTPLSLGIETKGNTFTRIIPRNTTIPTRKQKIFTTVVDNQSVVRIHVLQGEREIASENRSLGWFELVDIAPAPKGVPQIVVTFEIDADGIVRVSAKDKASGIEQKIKINPSSGLTPGEIERMVKEAEKYREEDIRRRETVKFKEGLKKLLDSLENSFNKMKSRMNFEDYETFDSYLEEAKRFIEVPIETADDLRHLKEVYERGEELQEKLYDIINEIYSKGFFESAGSKKKEETTEGEPGIEEIDIEDKDKDGGEGLL